MTITLVDVGTTANDGTGDPLRTAFQTVNTALTTLDNANADTAAQRGSSFTAAAATATAGLVVEKNNIPMLQQLDPDGVNHTVMYLDNDWNIVKEPNEPKLFPLCYKPQGTTRKMHELQAHSVYGANQAEVTAALLANGWKATAAGAGTLTTAVSGVNSLFIFDSATSADGDGYTIEALNLQTRIASDFRCIEFQISIPTELNLRLEAGLWNGATSGAGSYAFYVERSELGSVANFSIRSRDNGTLSENTTLSTGNNANRYIIQFWRQGTDIEVWTSDSGTAAGEYQLRATVLNANLPTGANMWPFVKFRSQGAAVSRTLHLDQFNMVANR